MSVQLLLPFEDVPVTCPTQVRYDAIAPCLAGTVETRKPRQTFESFLFNRFAVAQTVPGRRNAGFISGFRI